MSFCSKSMSPGFKHILILSRADALGIISESARRANDSMKKTVIYTPSCVLTIFFKFVLLVEFGWTSLNFVKMKVEIFLFVANGKRRAALSNLLDFNSLLRDGV